LGAVVEACENTTLVGLTTSFDDVTLARVVATSVIDNSLKSRKNNFYYFWTFQEA